MRKLAGQNRVDWPCRPEQNTLNVPTNYKGLGILNKTELTPGVFLAASLTRAKNGVCVTSIVNTTEQDQMISLPLVNLEQLSEEESVMTFVLSAVADRDCIYRQVWVFKKRGYLFRSQIDCTRFSPDPENVSAVKKFPSPTNTRAIEHYLDLCGYYRKFIPNFSSIAKPLTELQKKKVPFEWNQKTEDAFVSLKEILTTEPLLQYPDFSKPFFLTTDASNEALGAILSQGPIGQDLPMAYASRTLNNAERNFSTTEKELLAIVWVCKQYRPYLYGKKFTIVTDHKPLTWVSMWRTSDRDY